MRPVAELDGVGPGWLDPGSGVFDAESAGLFGGAVGAVLEALGWTGAMPGPGWLAGGYAARYRAGRGHYHSMERRALVLAGVHAGVDFGLAGGAEKGEGKETEEGTGRSPVGPERAGARAVGVSGEAVAAGSADPAQVAFSPDAVFALDEAVVHGFVEATVGRLTASLAWGGTGPVRPLVAPGRVGRVVEELQALVSGGAEALALGGEVRYSLGGGQVVVRGAFDAHGGRFAGQLDRAERAQVITRLQAQHETAAAGPEAAAGQVLWHQQRQAKSQARWYRYTYPAGLRALVEPGPAVPVLDLEPGGGQRQADALTVMVPDPHDLAQAHSPDTRHEAPDTRHGATATGSHDPACPPVPESAPTVRVQLDETVPGMATLSAHAAGTPQTLVGESSPTRVPASLAKLVGRLKPRTPTATAPAPDLTAAEADAVTAVVGNFLEQIAEHEKRGVPREQIRLLLPMTGTGIDDLIAGYRVGGLAAARINHRITLKTPDGGQVDLCP